MHWCKVARNGPPGMTLMISVVIATHNSERLLVPTLAALVPGALAGTVREVIVTDGGSGDATAMVADEAGCKFLNAPGTLGGRLRAAAASARSPWLLFLRPGTIPDAIWIDEVSRFLEASDMSGTAATQAAAFRRAAAIGDRPSMMREAVTLIASALGALPRPSQGLLISKLHYDYLGGHGADHADAERDLLQRIGRQRITMLRSGAVLVGAGR